MLKEIVLQYSFFAVLSYRTMFCFILVGMKMLKIRFKSPMNADHLS